MKHQITETICRISILLFGLSIAHLGVTLFLLANLGTDPFNVLVQGIFRTLSAVTNSPLLTHGRTHIVICLLIIIILLFVDRTYIKIGTLVCMLCGGPIIDVFTTLLSGLHIESAPLWSKLIILTLGCAILAFGMTIVIQSNAGTGPNDLVAVVISDKTHKKFSIVRICTDLSFVLIGIILGGAFGVGTIICAFLVGPVAGIFLPINKKIIQKLLAKARVGCPERH